ncbi:MAG: alpha/beta hydrolase [Dehalococcoidia bacterium]|nr:alpha/beta hydrolase [Dehalococcoidia bacterium]
MNVQETEAPAEPAADASDGTWPSHTVKVDGLNIHFKTSGTGSPLLLFHGRGADWRSWKQNAEFFSRYFRVFIPDLPGYGQSQRPDFPVSPEWLARFVACLADDLGLEKVSIVGHSLGAIFGLSFCIKYPERVNRLVLVNSTGNERPTPVGRLLLLFNVTDRLLKKGRGPAWTGDWEFAGKMKSVTCPVLIVWGRKDRFLPLSQAKAAHSLMPNSRLRILTRYGHAPHRECPDEFNKLVFEFLTE